MGFPCWLSAIESACNAGDPGLIPGSGRSLGGGHGDLLQYSCLENSRDRAWWALVHKITKSQTWLKQLSTAQHRQIYWKYVAQSRKWLLHFYLVSILLSNITLREQFKNICVLWGWSFNQMQAPAVAGVTLVYLQVLLYAKPLQNLI